MGFLCDLGPPTCQSSDEAAKAGADYVANQSRSYSRLPPIVSNRPFSLSGLAVNSLSDSIVLVWNLGRLLAASLGVGILPAILLTSALLLRLERGKIRVP